jgi:hypothetical protein
MAFNPLQAKTQALKLRELQYRFPERKIILTIWKDDVVSKKGEVWYKFINADSYNPYYNHYIAFTCFDEVKTEFNAFCMPGETFTLSVVLDTNTNITHLID